MSPLRGTLTVMKTPVPDYELEPTMVVGGDEVHAALADPRRRRILSLLSERAATARQLGVAIERSQQTTIHHLNTLEEAGLVRVVRTAAVRATEQRWWGRTARTFVVDSDAAEPGDRATKLRRLLREVAAEVGDGDTPTDRATTVATVRYARIPADRAEEWAERIIALAEEFTAQPRHGDVVHGLVLGLFPTTWQALPEDDE